MDRELSAKVRGLPPDITWRRPVVCKGEVWFGEKCPWPWSCWKEGEVWEKRE